MQFQTSQVRTHYSQSFAVAPVIRAQNCLLAKPTQNAPNLRSGDLSLLAHHDYNNNGVDKQKFNSSKMATTIAVEASAYEHLPKILIIDIIFNGRLFWEI